MHCQKCHIFKTWTNMEHWRPEPKFEGQWDRAIGTVPRKRERMGSLYLMDIFASEHWQYS